MSMMMPEKPQPQRYDYHSALMRRLGMINDLGANATMLQSRPQPMFGGLENMPALGQAAGRGGGGFDAFMGAISAQESGGNYGARNRDSGAMGKYQIMPANLGGRRSGWDYEALGRDITPAQFMSSPQLQEAIARYKLQRYFQQYGPAGAAVAWYAGPGVAAKYLRNPGKYTAKQGNYPSIAQYVAQILGRMR